jgi:superfamily II DNA or RNA helicase
MKKNKYDLIEGKIISIKKKKFKKIDRKTFYDIEVKDNHNYFANDILVHNSATPSREDGYDDMIEAHVGPLSYTKGISELIKEGYLSKPKIYMIDIPYYENNPLTYKSMYAKFIKDETINKYMAEVAYRFAKQGKTVLMSFTRVEHLKKVYKELKKINKLDLTIEKVIGADSADDKELALKELNNKNYNIVLSTLFGEGANIPKLDVLENCRNSKSDIDVVQQTGRGLRIGDGKKYIIDFYYHNTFNETEQKTINNNNSDDFFIGDDEDEGSFEGSTGDVKDYFKSYSKRRLDFYKSESEFEVVVVDDINSITEIAEEK